MATVSLNATERTTSGKGAARKLRQAGLSLFLKFIEKSFLLIGYIKNISPACLGRIILI